MFINLDHPDTHFWLNGSHMCTSIPWKKTTVSNILLHLSQAILLMLHPLKHFSSSQRKALQSHMLIHKVTEAEKSKVTEKPCYLKPPLASVGCSALQAVGKPVSYLCTSQSRKETGNKHYKCFILLN